MEHRVTVEFVFNQTNPERWDRIADFERSIIFFFECIARNGNGLTDCLITSARVMKIDSRVIYLD